MNITLKAGLASAALAVAACFDSCQRLPISPAKGGSIKDGYVPLRPRLSTAPPAPATSVPTSATPGRARQRLSTSATRTPSVRGAITGRWRSVRRRPRLRHGLARLARRNHARRPRDREIQGRRRYRSFARSCPVDPPIQTTLKTYTMMFNAYYDLGKFGGFVPYVGAGVGLAYHKMGDVTIDNIRDARTRIHGENKLSFAWSLMAGIGYQLTDRAILDFGYRYIDMGLARALARRQRPAWNPRSTSTTCARTSSRSACAITSARRTAAPQPAYAPDEVRRLRRIAFRRCEPAAPPGCGHSCCLPANSTLARVLAGSRLCESCRSPSRAGSSRAGQGHRHGTHRSHASSLVSGSRSPSCATGRSR